VKPSRGNDADRIQGAIDRVSALAPDKKGFRGAVLIKRGRYELDKPLRIAASGVVLRGEGEGMFLVQKPPTAQNYAIGHTGIHAMIFNTRYMDYKKEDGYIESLDEKVQPRSLYRKQLEDRLGKKAVRNIERSE